MSTPAHYFQPGNQLAAKVKHVDSMIRSVLAQDDRGRLRTAIEVTLDKASNGCLASLDWIATRLEGRANQQVQIDSTLAISIETDRPKLSADQWLMQHGVIDVIPSVINELAHSETIPVQPRDSLTTPP